MSILLLLTLLGLLIVIDLAVKGLVENQIALGTSFDVARGKVTIRKVYNRGMALNFLAGFPQWVRRITLGVTIAVTIRYIIGLFQGGAWLWKLGGTLLVAGAWGNLLDRLLRGHVIDFVAFKSKWQRLSNITFNLADFFIFFGGAFILIASLVGQGRKGNK